LTVTIVASASGTRIDCDRCGSHAASPDLAVALLRRATGFIRRDDADLCPDCADAPDEDAEPALVAWA
jgi:hypothetical protein